MPPFSFALISVFRVTTLSIIILVSLLTPPFGYKNNIIIAYAQEEMIEGVNASIGGEELPSIKDPNLRVQLVSKGLEFPTSMAFLGPNDILVLEKEKGTIQRIVNGKMLPTPVLTVNVATEVERGMLGIAVSKSDSVGSIYVFLYFTEAGGSGSGGDTDDTISSSEPVGNRLYRYEWINNQLVNPKLLLDLPAIPGPRHNGGVVTIGPDNNVYVIIGDVDGHETQAQNQESGEEHADGTSGILRITQDGKPVVGIAGGEGILGNSFPLNLYYAYGIRNSFGFDFDPVTGNIWDTENGPGYGDEINLVEPGFNSGWLEITGFPSSASSTSTDDDEEFNPADDLVSFGGKGKYSDPEFEWTDTLGPTAVKFLNSDKLGIQYVNDMFVADVVTGRTYHFDLNEDRTQLILDGLLADKIAETRDTGIENIVFAEGFGGITDLEVGPDDGYLYVVSLGHGAIYKILPATSAVSIPDDIVEEEEEDKNIEGVGEPEEDEDSDED
ncbi:MAG TPA: PQQ-dependent sugar dehydrogenase [Nitrososphaeraceae archaeon]|nr:PQQ-dependent sugar dehydrogenase [Nitrososphaeraceae archaeon]